MAESRYHERHITARAEALRMLDEELAATRRATENLAERLRYICDETRMCRSTAGTLLRAGLNRQTIRKIYESTPRSDPLHDLAYAAHGDANGAVSNSWWNINLRMGDRTPPRYRIDRRHVACHANNPWRSFRRDDG